MATTPATTFEPHNSTHACQPAQELPIICISTSPLHVLYKQAQLPQGLGVLCGKAVTHLAQDCVCLHGIAFGKENPSPNDNPQKVMANSLLAMKKKISYFMVNRLPCWDPLHNHGNPTKSTEVKDLIAFVKKKETRGKRQEVPS